MSTTTCTYAFTIPLSRENAIELQRALRLVQEHGHFELPPEGPADAQTYDWALSTAPPEDDDPKRSRIALAIINAMWDNGECEGDYIPKDLEFKLFQPREGLKWTDQHGLYVETRKGAWGSVNLATALIEVSQAELGALPVWFSFHTHDGWTNAGAVFIAPGEEPISIDLEEWGMEQEFAYQKRQAAAKQTRQSDPVAEPSP